MKKARLLLFISLVILAILPLNGSATAQTGTVVYVDPELTEVEPGDSFTVEVWVKDVVDLWAFDLVLTYNTTYLIFESAELGDFLSEGIFLGCNEDENFPGEIRCINAQKQDESEPQSESGILFSVNFTARQEEAYTYLLVNNPTEENPGLTKIDEPIFYVTQDGAVQIGDAEPGFEAFIPVFLH